MKMMPFCNCLIEGTTALKIDVNMKTNDATYVPRGSEEFLTHICSFLGKEIRPQAGIGEL